MGTTTDLESLLPSASDKAFFAENGYWIAPRLFDEATVAAAQEHARRVIEGSYDRGEGPYIVYPVADPERGLRKIDDAWWADSVIASIVTSPVIGRIAAELLGVEEVYLWHDQLLWKPGTSEAFGNVGWHQDKGYWSSASGEEMITAWVALDDITEDMGPMRFVSGSNHWDLLPQGSFFDGNLEAQRERIESSGSGSWNEAAALMSAGQASFHHCKTFHGSGPNTTGRSRRSLAIHLMSGETRLVKGNGHPNERLLDGPDGSLWRGPRFPRLWPV